MTQQLFVYGTLMRGELRHDLVKSAELIVPARAKGRLYHLSQGYPAFVPDYGNQALHEEVLGELCIFSDLDAILPQIDAYEGVDDWPRSETSIAVVDVCFRRELISVTSEGRPSIAWCYVVDPEQEAQMVASGCFRVYGRWTAVAWKSRKDGLFKS